MHTLPQEPHTCNHHFYSFLLLCSLQVVAGAKGAQSYRSLGGWKHLCTYLCGLSYVSKASKVKKREVGLKRRICRAQVKYRNYMLGTVHVSIQVFFTEMVISSSQRGTSPSLRASSSSPLCIRFFLMCTCSISKLQVPTCNEFSVCRASTIISPTRPGLVTELVAENFVL